MATGRQAIDWEGIERDYRAGVLSVREIATSHDVSHVAIGKRAKRDGWDRDLAAKIKAKADSLVTKSMVTSEVTRESAVTDRVIVEASAQVIANVRITHRADIRRTRNLAMDMLAELEAQTGSNGLFEELGEILRSEDDKGADKRNDIYKKVISSAQRIDSVKKLSETLKTLIGLERQAFGIPDVDGPSGNQDLPDDQRKARLAVLQAKLNGPHKG